MKDVAEVFKVLCLVLAKIALVIVMILFMFSLSSSFILEKGLSSLLVSGLTSGSQNVQHRELISAEEFSEDDLEKLYSYIMDEFGITEEQLLKVLESGVIDDLITDFADTVLKEITSGDMSNFNLGEKILTFVENNQSEIETLIGQPLPIEKIEKFAESEEVKRFNEQYKEAFEVIKGRIPNPLMGVLRFIERLISKEFRNVCLIWIFALTVLIALLQWSWYKWIRTLGNTILGVGIFMFIINLFGNLCSSGIALLLGFGGVLGFGKALLSSAISIGIGIVLLISYVLLKKKFVKVESNCNISQNAI